MPLDMTGPRSNPSFKGMLITLQSIGEHFGHHTHCFYGAWADTAAELAAQKYTISASEIYMTTSIEITTGHLNNHRNKTAIMAVLPSCDASLGQGKREIIKEITGEPAQQLCERVGVFPISINLLISEERPFDVAIVKHSTTISFYSVDLSQSKKSNSVCLKECLTVRNLGNMLIL